ncbi:MAG TPA: 2-dehydropantoate 2-reductase [Candidatus Binataceae bacterium]|jgi:2-dehydropantoate 2-reductase|nr:2-dehydropantoate 2-reductase [Candidatus Binataceae bacterium]
MKILIMGAGAVGLFYGARLQRSGEDVYYCARGENLRVLREYGLEVKSFQGDFNLQVKATGDPREFAPYELILFCVKSYDTLATARLLDGCLAEGGAVMTIQNGVENEAALCTVLPRESVMGGNARVGAELTAPGKLLHTASGIIEFGELDGSETPRAQRMAEAFKRAGVFGQFTRDLKSVRWKKLMGNNGTNTVSALARCTLGEMFAEPESDALVLRLINETAMVGRAEGAKISDEDVEALYNVARNFSNASAIKTSTLQDLERGKRLEYDAISGAVVRAARRHSLSVPATETVHALLKLLDAHRG